MSKMPLIEVSGSYYDIGYQIGQKLKKNIKKTIKIPEQLSKNIDTDSLIKASQNYLPYTNKYFPQYVKELKGIADGSGQEFDKLLLLNTEEVLNEQLDKCTSIVYKESKDKLYLYHNEDFDEKFTNNTAIVKAKINNKTKFLSLTFAGMLPGSSVSINSYGLIQGINSLHPTETRIGIPRNFISRAIIECKNINEALKIIKIKERASAYNHILIHGKKAIDVETTAKKYKILNIKKNIFVHTNHYLYKKFKNNYTPTRSIKRLNLAYDILNKNKEIDKKTILSILTSHSNGSNICLHDRIIEDDITLSSLIADSHNKKLYASKGNPCRNKYDEYSME